MAALLIHLPPGYDPAKLAISRHVKWSAAPCGVESLRKLIPAGMTFLYDGKPVPASWITHPTPIEQTKGGHR